MKVLKIVGWTLLALLIIAQFVAPGPPENKEDNPGDLIANGLATPEVAQLLKNSCYDCHSNEVVYPWYSHVAPVSLLVRHDVLEGRDELNFSEWQDAYDKRRKLRKLKEVGEVIEEGEMPLGIYTLMHPGAKLSESDQEMLIEWAKETSAKVMEMD
ncbi:MAG: heme-binding domain-containing protein [Saprospiraceae bacterium]